MLTLVYSGFTVTYGTDQKQILRYGEQSVEFETVGLDVGGVVNQLNHAESFNGKLISLCISSIML